MPDIIRCIDGPNKGRDLTLDSDKPLELDVRRQEGGEVGKLRFRFVGGAWRFENSSHLTSKVNDEPLQEAELADGDRIRVGPFLFEAQLAEMPDDGVDQLDGMIADEIARDAGAVRDEDETVPAMPALFPGSEAGGDDPDGPDEAGAGEKDEMRRSERARRRISASQEAVVDDEEKQGLLRKVGRVFRRRDGDGQRLEQLEEEREDLLYEVGRLALQQQGGIGLPEGFLVRLSQGERLDVEQRVFNQPALDRFRRNRERLSYLDTEIAALRQKLGLEPEPRRPSISDRQLPTEHKEQANRAFEAMDAINTEELHGASTEAHAVEEAAPEPPRRPSLRRRRRRRR